MALEYLGKAIKFPFQTDVNGKLALAEGVDVVLQSCYLILATPIGEQIFLPEFGSKLSLLLYQSYHNGTKSLISSVIESAITKWEGRCDFVSCDFDESEKDNGKIGLIISVRIRSTSEVKSFVYPFYSKLIN